MVEISKEFNSNEWRSPNSYSSNFASVPASPGVYLIAKPFPNYKHNRIDYVILYIGSSGNLLKRKSVHKSIPKIRKEHGYIQFFFIETEDYKELEKRLIKRWQPMYNIQFKYENIQ